MTQEELSPTTRRRFRTRVTSVTSSSVTPPYQPQIEPLRVTRAIYGVPGKEADVKDRLNDLIDDEWVLDFFADNATLADGDDPAPNEFKKLRMRWTERGVAKASWFYGGDARGDP